MNIRETIGNFLHLPTKKDIEMLKEELATQKLVMENSDSVTKPLSFPSSQAIEQKVVDDVPGLVVKRVPVKELQHLYLNNQFIFRGVNVRADELITRGYKIIGEDTKGVELCKELIKNSGGENLFWQMSINTDVAGDGYLEKVPNTKGNKLMILKHINPLSFGFLTDKTTQLIILNDKNMPKAYEQIIYDKEGKENYNEISKDRIAHLRYNTYADEFNGISSIQPVYNTTVRLMNMEQAAAEAAVKTANPIIVGMTETKSPQELLKWSQMMGRISAKEQVFLPQGVKLTMISPGYQNFSAYSDYFLDAVVAALGVPKSILTGSSGASGGNRSTVTVQARHFYSVIRANQRYIEQLFNENIFVDYANRANFKPPKLSFNDIAEDADVNGQRATELYGAGLITVEEARTMIGLDTSNEIKKELTTIPVVNTKKVDAETKSEREAFFPAKPGSPTGSQKGIKKEQKNNPDVKSVRK